MRASLPEGHAAASRRRGPGSGTALAILVPVLLVVGLLAGAALAEEPAAPAPAKPVAARKPAPVPGGPVTAPLKPVAAPAATVTAPPKPVAAPAAAVTAPPKPATAPGRAVTTPLKPVAAPAKAAVTGPVKATTPAGATARTASASAMVGTVPPAGARGGPPPVAHLDERLTYQYNALGRRDPFQSLVSGAFVGADVGGDSPPDVGGIKVVGIVWGTTDQFALIEDARGNSMVLRRGDKVQNGFVEGLRRDALIVNLTADGQAQTVVIPLTKKGDQNASR